VNHVISTAVVLAEFVDLGVAVMAAGDAVVGTGGLDLLVLEHAVLKSLFLKPGLQEPAAAAAEVVGAVGLHVDEILFTDDGSDDVAQILGNGVTVAFADDLAGILDRKLDFQVLLLITLDL